MYFHVKWSLAFVVVVVESKWGYTPLKRSAYLVKGMRLVTLFVMLYFWICGAVLVWLYSYSFQFAVSRSWTFIVVFTMLSSFSMMMCLLRITAATTVLYNYCKALHGELVIETEEGCNHDYVNLPSYLDKVPNVVTFVTTV
ncbi:uncharacterized protein [Rutidosis leptorrhynchoides]|uniref:uncharacterized protein n=1 Tax=Rutidosis leptorrhynchoides TaxID=125765 RepID=UPI003A99F440